MIPIREYEGAPMNAATTLLARINALRQQKQNLEFDRAQEERAAEAARVLEEERQLRMRQTEALMKDAELKRAKEAAALIKSTTPGEKTVTPKVEAAPLATPLTESEMMQFGEPNAAESAREITTVPRADIPEMVTETPGTPRAPIEVDMGGGIGTVRVPFQDELEAEAKRKRRETEININDPDVQEQIKQLPEGLGSMIRIMADSEGFLPRTGLAGSLAALSKSPTDRIENPEPVVIDGHATLATPTEIAEAKKAGKRVDVYRAPTGGGAGEGPSPTSLLNAQMGIGASFMKYTKDASTAKSQKSILSSSLSEAKKAIAEKRSLGPATQAIVTVFNKILDPSSVVRESEYARTPEGQSYLKRIDGWIQRISFGGAGLTLAELQDIEKAANALMDGYTRQQLNYARLAKRQADMIGKLSGGMLGDINTILPPDMVQMLEGGDGSGGEQEFVRGPDGKLVPKGK